MRKQLFTKCLLIVHAYSEAMIQLIMSSVFCIHKLSLRATKRQGIEEGKERKGSMAF